MSLQRFTNNLRTCGLLTVFLLLSACASDSSKPGDDGANSRGQEMTGPNGQPVALRDVPPTALTLYEQAVASMASGDTIDAELRFQEFLLQYPDFPGAHVNLAIIFAARGDETAAEGSLTDALIIDPQYAPALNQLGMQLRRQGKFIEAESAYLKAVTANPDYALAHYNLGILNDLYFQRLDTALQHYERYQAIVGEDKEVTRWITDLKRRLGTNSRSANVTE